MILGEEHYIIKMIGFLVWPQEPGKLLLYMDLFMFVCMYVYMHVFFTKKIHACMIMVWNCGCSYVENFNIATWANAVGMTTVAVVETIKAFTLPPQLQLQTVI